MVKRALVGLLVGLLAFSSGNLAAAQTTAKAKTKATTTKATTTKATTAKTLTKSKSTGTTKATGTTATATTKKTLTKSSSTNTRVIRPKLPSNGLPNWVGPVVPAATGAACYRKTHRASKTCATGYALDAANLACWAECPLDYPIQCGMQCLAQSKDCTEETIKKIAVVANAALSTATVGVLGQLTTAVKAIDVTVRCGTQLFGIISKAIEYIGEIEEKAPVGTKAALFALLMKSDFAVIDLPLAVATCIGAPVANAFSTAAGVVAPIKKIVEKIVASVSTLRAKALQPKEFIAMTTAAGVKSMKETDVSKLDKVITCGGKLKEIVDKITAKVKELKEQSPTAPLDAIRLAIASSELVLVDIPEATKNCVPKSTKSFYAARDQVRRAFSSIVDSVVDASSAPTSKAKNAPLKPLSKKQYALKIAGFSLDVIGFFDPTGMAKLVRAYAQKICGPTQFFGEVDDGALKDSLGLNIIGKAFETSNGAYKKVGDGMVKINFLSSDTKDVEINIFSAGVKVGSVALENGKAVTWTKSMKLLQDKTLYLDRWRPGALKIPGTGGGSLVMWIPHSSKKGHVELHAVVNVS